MRTKVYVQFFLCLAAFTAAAPLHNDCKGPDPSLPRDVGELKSKLCLCNHFLGEEPYDQERRQFLEKAVRESCSGLLDSFRKVSEQHKGDARLQKALEELHPEVDAADYGNSVSVPAKGSR